MNYKQRYNEALERAKEWMDGKYGHQVSDTPKEIAEFIFPELNESEDERIRKQIISFLKEFEHDHYRCLDFSSWISWLEKQGDNTNKVEPKFKVGDWVVFNSHHQSIYQVEKIEDGYYILRHTHGGTFRVCVLHDESLRLWTIEDAKDGDVLCTYECGEPKIVFILKGTPRKPKKPYVLRYYCYYNLMYPYFESDSETGCLAPNEEDVKPATKEQRDLLFTKMEEAGYEWDANKKEMKKMEQTIEIPFGAKDSELQEATYHIPDGYHAEINGNEVSIKKGKQKTTWKPTEEQIEALEHLLETIRRHEYSYFHEEKFLSLHSLLEQLKKL